MRPIWRGPGKDAGKIRASPKTSTSISTGTVILIRTNSHQSVMLPKSLMLHAARNEHTHDDPGQPRARRATRASPWKLTSAPVELIIIISRCLGVCVEATLRLYL